MRGQTAQVHDVDDDRGVSGAVATVFGVDATGDAVVAATWAGEHEVHGPTDIAPSQREGDRQRLDERDRHRTQPARIESRAAPPDRARDVVEVGPQLEG